MYRVCFEVVSEDYDYFTLDLSKSQFNAIKKFIEVLNCESRGVTIRVYSQEVLK